MSKICVFNKVGSLVNRPDWRFFLFSSKEVISKLRGFLRQDEHLQIGSYLKRFVNPTNTDSYTDNLKLTPEGQSIYNDLTSEEKSIFDRMQEERLKEQHLKKRTFRKDSSVPLNNYRWRVKDIEKIKDDFFQKLVKHYAQIEYNEDIEFALRFKFSSDNEASFRYVGYSLYLGLTDKMIATKWMFKPSQVEAIRLLFFDFSNRPKDTVASSAYLRQLVSNDVMTQADYEFYKIIDELGDIGLKARSNFYTLSDAEKFTVKSYLAGSAIENVLNIKVSVRTMKDATAYNGVIGSFNNFCLAQENIKLLKAREDNLRANTDRVRAFVSQVKTGVLDADQENLKYMDMIYNMSLENNAPPSIKTLNDLKQ